MLEANLTKCPNCGNDIPEKAEKCPSSGWASTGEPVEQKAATDSVNEPEKPERCVPADAEERKEEASVKEPSEEEKTDAQEENEKAEVPVQEEETPVAEESADIQKKKKHGKCVTAVIGAAVLIAGGYFVLSHHSGSSKINLTSDGWSYIERTDGKDVSGVIHASGKKNLALLTKSGRWILVKDGECHFSENISSDKDMQDPVSVIYELKDPADTDLNVQVGKLSCEMSDYSSIFNQYAQVETTITADSEKPFLLFYHFEDGGGNIPVALMSNIIPYEMITEKETSISDSIWFIDSGDNTDFQLVIDGVVTFDLEEDPEVEFGTASDKTDSYYTVTQPVTVASGKSGLLLANVKTDGKIRNLNCYQITDGEGTMNWGTTASEEDDSDIPDEVSFVPEYFAPSEFSTDYVLNFTDAEKKAATLEEVYEKSRNLYRGTVILAGDGSYLKFDTNPSDEEDGGYTDVWKEIAEANKMFGLPESINERMKTTNSMDGKVTETVDGIKVTWSYHPDRGLEVMYEKQ